MAFTLVSNVGAKSTDTLAVTTAGIDTSGANLLVLVLASYQPGPVPTISDSNTNTWTPLTTYETSGQARVKLYYAASPIVGASHTFTALAGSANYPSIWVAAFSGAILSPFRAENGLASDGGGSGDRNPGSVAAGGNTDLFVSGYSELAAGATMSVANGFTITDQGDGNANAIGGALAYKIQTSAGAENPTWSINTSSFVEVSQAAFTALNPALSSYWKPNRLRPRIFAPGIAR